MKLTNKFDFLKNFKAILITCLSLVLVGIVLICVFGLNLGADFVGSTDVSIKIGEEISSSNNYSVYENYKDEIVTIIEQNGGKVLSVQKYSDGVDSTIIVKIKNLKTQSETENKSETIVNALQTNYSAKSFDIEYAINQGGNIGATTLVNAIYTTLIFIIVIMVYLLIRYKILYSLSAVVSMLSTIILTVLLLAIVRIPLDITVYVGIIISVMYSLMLTLNAVIKLFNDDKMKTDKKAKSNINNYMFKCSLTTAAIIACLVFITLVCLISGLTNIMFFSLLMIISILSGGISSLFGLYYFNFFNTYTEPKIKVEAKKNEQE